MLACLRFLIFFCWLFFLHLGGKEEEERERKKKKKNKNKKKKKTINSIGADTIGEDHVHTHTYIYR